MIEKNTSVVGWMTQYMLIIAPLKKLFKLDLRILRLLVRLSVSRVLFQKFGPIKVKAS